MRPVVPTSPLFIQEEIHMSNDPLIQTVRTLFAYQPITNQIFLDAYKASLKSRSPEFPEGTLDVQAEVVRKKILTSSTITQEEVENVLTALNFEVIQFDVTESDVKLVVKDATGKKFTYASSVGVADTQISGL